MWMLRPYLARALAEITTSHGVFLDVLGMGVLITGDSGVGKSELALELISRGSGLVADDVVELYRIGPETIEGRCPTLLRDFLEVRGLGVLNIRTDLRRGGAAPAQEPEADRAPRAARAGARSRSSACRSRRASRRSWAWRSCKVTIPVAAGPQPRGADRGGGAQPRAAAARHRQHARIHRAAGRSSEA